MSHATGEIHTRLINQLHQKVSQSQRGFSSLYGKVIVTAQVPVPGFVFEQSGTSMYFYAFLVHLLLSFWLTSPPVVIFCHPPLSGVLFLKQTWLQNGQCYRALLLPEENCLCPKPPMTALISFSICGHCPFPVLEHKTNELEQRDTETGGNLACYIRHPKKMLKSSSLLSLLAGSISPAPFLPSWAEELNPALPAFWMSLSFHQSCTWLSACSCCAEPRPPYACSCTPESSPCVLTGESQFHTSCPLQEIQPHLVSPPQQCCLPPCWPVSYALQ